MGKADLQTWLVGTPGFQARYHPVLIDSVVSQFSGLERSLHAPDMQDWRYLLLCASLLAQSDQERCQDVALRIGQYCLECAGTSDVERHAAAVVLDTLANRPAISLAENRGLLQPDCSRRLPLPLLQDWTRRSLEYSVRLSSSASLQVNRFQRRFWKSVGVHDWISISAPTSAGKSFIVGRWLAEYIRVNPHATIVYIVPTRALIQQVQRDIEDIFQHEKIENTSVVTLPLHTSLKSNQANVFVFTQERLHVLLAASDDDISVDLMIVDEAQKVGDSYRGVLLQQAIEAVVCRNPKCKILFASPMTANPEVLLEDAPSGVSREAIMGEDMMVNQNLIWVSQVPRQPRRWKVELILKENPVEIGTIELPETPTHISKRLSFVAHSLSNCKGGNVIYVNGAAEAEKTAKQLYDLIGDVPELSEDKEILNLIELTQKTIHPEYCLRHVLRRGVAFHYGNMPLLIRTEIERLFSRNTIRYLVCTSTLIEGVNMPCQSIFVRGPQKGRNKPMTSSDFWNLAGRAGRWTKEFQGNVICVDAKSEGIWKNGAPKGRRKFRISRTSDEVLSRGDDLLSFIDNGTPRDEAAKNPNLEYVCSYLVSSYLRSGSIPSAPWAHRFSTEHIEALDEKIAALVADLRTPKEMVLRNPGISPLAMDSLLAYFEHRTQTRQEPVEELIPPPPESEDAFEAYVQILHRINKHLGFVFGVTKRVPQLALLIVDWMNGYPLARIIASRQRYYKQKGIHKDLPSLIRGTMQDVEEFARFQGPKYLACYVDILRVHLDNIGRQELVGRLLDLNILLEFGVSQATQLSLIGLGLSRSSAIALSELIAGDSLHEVECLDWLQENDWMTKDMPELVKQEVAAVLAHKRKVS